jgi:hypothetical protein
VRPRSPLSPGRAQHVVDGGVAAEAEVVAVRVVDHAGQIVDAPPGPAQRPRRLRRPYEPGPLVGAARHPPSAYFAAARLRSPRRYDGLVASFATSNAVVLG